jgi:hypothetical protein
MSDITKEVSIRRFCGSLARRIHLWRSRGKQEQDEIAFSAFEDGSIEIERAGVKQRFRNFSGLERRLNYRGRE